MTLRGTTVIMADVKSDEVKQSLDNLEKYLLFTEGNSNRSFTKNSTSVVLTPQDHAEGEMCHLLTQLPLTGEERNNLVMYSGSFLPVWYRAGVVCTECLLTKFWYLFSWFHSWFLHFSWIEHTLETIKSSNPFALISLSWNRYQEDSINRMNDGQANHYVEFRKSRLTNGIKSLSTKDKEPYSE